MQFYLTSLRGKNILPNLTNSQQPELVFFGPLELEPEPEPEPFEKKYQQPEPESCWLPSPACDNDL